MENNIKNVIPFLEASTTPQGTGTQDGKNERTNERKERKQQKHKK